MRRVALVLAALFLCGAAPTTAQTPIKTARVGVLSGAPLSAPGLAPFRRAFVEVLRERGWEEGRNLVIENRFTEGKAELFGGRAWLLLGGVILFIPLSRDGGSHAGRSRECTAAGFRF